MSQPTNTDLGTARPYGPGESMQDQLQRVGLWLQRHRVLYTERDLHPDPRSRHMFVSDAEFDAVAAATATGRRRGGARLDEIEASLQRLEAHIQRRMEATMLQGATVPLEDLRALFRLDDLSLDVLVALAAPEMDPRVARAYTNAWADFTRRQVDVAFLVELLCPTEEQKQTLRDRLAAGGELRQSHLIHTVESDRWKPDTPLLYLQARLSDRLVDFMLTGRRDRLDETLSVGASLRDGQGMLEQLLLPNEIKQRLLGALRVTARARVPFRVGLLGPAGCGKRSLAAGVNAHAGRRLLVIKVRRMPQEPEAIVRWLTTARRDARLAMATLYLDLSDATWVSGMEGGARDVLLDFLARSPDDVWFGSDTDPDWLGMAGGFLVVQVPFPTFEVQEALWRRHLAGRAALEEGFTLDALVAGHSLSGGAIEVAASEALHQARLENPGPRLMLSRRQASDAAQAQLTHRLGLLAEKVTRSLTWDDLVLPEDLMASLQALVDQYRHQNLVFNEWGFRDKVAYGRGLSALFHGPPGTGKTMVAGIIARELGLEIYKIDLSRVVDKYIGETEKNLGRIFDEAARSNAILLFDEADSLFSKRTKVKSSHDRYANLETNYLLQRVESFDGVCLLTTNFEASIDDAFKRRLRFKIAFPFPDVKERALLWEHMIPEQAQAATDIHFEALAEDFEMTGGHIKNAVLRAAFYAARERTHIDHDILIRAAMEEYREMGKLVRDEEDW